MRDRRTESVRFWLGYGAVLWVAGTAAMRIAGGLLFDPGSAPRLAIAYVLAVPLVAALTFPAYERLGVLPPQRIRAAGAIVLANLVPDALALAFFERLFPNMEPAAAPYVGAWLVWCYGLFLVTGLVSPRRRTTHLAGGAR